MRHSSVLISEMIQMRRDGLTLTEIQNKTGLSKTTIFHHIQSIPKSDALKYKLRLISQELQKRVSDSRRGKSVKNYTFNKPEKWSPDFVNLVSHFLFDGQITRGSCTYYNRNEILLNGIIKSMNKILGVSDYKKYDSSGGVKRVAYHNVEIVAFLQRKRDELQTYILSASKKEKLSFLKSFFDDEGCVSYSSKRRLVRGYQHSIDILKIISTLLSELKIKNRIDEKYYEIYISQKENLIKFQKLINFTSGITVNGNRSNSIWKKSLEKREILDMAIASYKIDPI
ncbi:MAG: LAGLIDADG family homing endonuclease [bacterium]|nr:LAGLIDADG family homing endonuclease [bacterium]